MSEGPRPPDPHRPLDHDLPCTRCGYNLRDLTLERLCPECGTPIDRSAHGNLLRYADPDWLDKLRLGTALMLWALLLSLVGGLSGSMGVALGLPQGVLGLIGLIGGAVSVSAMFLVTTPEPAVAFAEETVTLRKVVRTTAIMSFLGLGLHQSAQLTGRASILFAVSGLLFLPGIVAQFGFLMLFRRLALRVPDERFARSTRIVLWGYSLTMTVVITAGFVVALGVTGAGPTTPAGRWGVVALGVPVCGGGAAFLVFLIWYVVLLFRYHATFKTAGGDANQTLVQTALEAGSSRDGDRPGAKSVREEVSKRTEPRP